MCQILVFLVTVDIAQPNSSFVNEAGLSNVGACIDPLEFREGDESAQTPQVVLTEKGVRPGIQQVSECECHTWVVPACSGCVKRCFTFNASHSRFFVIGE